ncbi:lipopolysaccharide biosynthesis protein [Rhizobium sp. TH2]|uniref:GumC family protein n=1 Tax=Rhizobium sp. TH2 TaxID=2775403 RepID=UPI002157F8AD|nr:exopolysaccharide transport family protein [Rhizobium sp. TH2]UVC07724.1 lipopolysaccharide biosynthesis protein [Rhizobium sp. TH2]
MVVHTLPNSASSDPHYGRKPPEREYLSFRDVWGFITRYFPTLAIFAIAGVAVGILYVVNTQPTFQATTRLVMDPEQGRVSWQDAATGAIIIETAEIASQVEIVKSEMVAQTVIHKLDLTKDPELLESRSLYSLVRGTLASIAQWFDPAPEAVRDEEVDSETEMMRRTMGAFLGRVSVQRVGQSYVLEIGYTSTNPKKAALVANTLAQAYIRVGMNDRADMARSGAKWLESRLLEVGEKAREASISAQEFRAKNNITIVSNQFTLDQQQLSEVSSQLLAARAATASEIASLESLQQAVKLGDGVELSGLGLDGTFQKLRDDMRAAESRLEILRSRYDPGNPAITAAEAEISRLKDAVKQEYDRVEAVRRSSLSAARTREHLSEERLTVLSKSAAEKNEAIAELSEIESRANTYKRIYESLLQQLVGTVQTQSFPLGKARVVTAAMAPMSKTWPKTSVIVPFSGMIGLAIGLTIAMLRQNLNHRTSSAGHLRRELGINSLGHVPVWKAPKSKVLDDANFPESLAPLRSVMQAPYSSFSEALRSVKNSIDSTFPEGVPMVVGITSVGPGEGKTTISINLAQLYRNEGRSVVLIDADFASSRLSRMATTFPKDLALERLPSVDEPIHVNEDIPHFVREGQVLSVKKSRPVSRPKLDIGPAGVAVPVFTSAQIKERKIPHQHYSHLPALKNAIEKLREQYEVMIVDMSAFEDSADTRAVCNYLDGIIVVLGRSKKMTIERLSAALARFGKSRLTILGSISNRSNY